MDVALNVGAGKRRYQPRPIRVRVADLETPSSLRRLVARVADATSRGLLTPAKSQAILAAIRTYAVTMETEAAERLSQQLEALQRSPTPRARLEHRPVMEAEVVSP